MTYPLYSMVRMWSRAAGLAVVLTLTACGSTREAEPVERELSDSAFAALQARGAAPHAMGVDQYTSLHRFESLPDGGRIELQREVDDPEGVEQIRTHLRHIASAFAQGDFTIPAFVHDLETVPGTEVMRLKRSVIEYRFEELPRGGEVRIRSADPEAIEAIHTFLAFQRSDHRTHDHSGH